MASSVPQLRQLTAKIIQASRPGMKIVQKRTMSVYTQTGAIPPRPYNTQLGTLKSIMTVFPFLYAGATLSKSAAAFLEENDIFVPDDDDD